MNALLLIALCSTSELSTPAPEAVRLDEPRLRFGVGYWFGSGNLGTDLGGTGGVGFTIHAGIQLNDHFAFYMETQASTLLVLGIAQQSALAELSLNDYFSVASGIGLAATYNSLWGFPEEGYAIGAPLRLTLTLGPKSEDSARRRFFVAVNGFVGVNPDRAALGWSAGVGLGWQTM
jgi:hypothetical protein